jgi:hypothetical protein
MMLLQMLVCGLGGVLSGVLSSPVLSFSVRAVDQPAAGQYSVSVDGQNGLSHQENLLLYAKVVAM